jgi:hypothetical protein
MGTVMFATTGLKATGLKATGLKAVRFAAMLSLAIAPFCALPGGALAQSDQDPPDDVGRIAAIAGTVSYHEPGSQDWQAATANYPLAPGSGVWVEPRSHAAVDVGGARIHLDGSSELEITAIEPQSIQVSVSQGAVFLHVYPGVTGQTFEVDTPHGAARISQPGQYEIVAGDDQHPMTVSVVEGAAQVAGQTANLNLLAGQRGSIAPDNSSGVDAAQQDDFIRMVQAEEQPYAASTASVAQTAQYVAPSMPGYQDLARYGQWQQNPQYGAVWMPRQVAADWAPYRDGHWSYVEPWGWTWIDNAPWGFTPFHYGRWIQTGGRWGWTPGIRAERPVYAPALVTFFGDVGAAAVSLSVGWVPLAPDEVYVPPYRHSDRYGRDINMRNVRNHTKIVNITNNTTVINYNDFRNRGGATMVSRDVITNSRSVARAYRKPSSAQNQQQWAHARRIDNAQIGQRPAKFGQPSKGPQVTVVQSGKAQGRTVYQYPNGEVRTQPKSVTEQNQRPQYNRNAVAKPPLPRVQANDNANQHKWQAQPSKPVHAPSVNNTKKTTPATVIPPVNGGTKAKPNAGVGKPSANGNKSWSKVNNARDQGHGNVAKPSQKPNVVYPPVTGKSDTQQKPAAHVSSAKNPTFAKPSQSNGQSNGRFKPQTVKQNTVRQNTQKQDVQRQTQQPQTAKQSVVKPNVAKPNAAKVLPPQNQAPKPAARGGQPCGGKQTACGSQVQ